MAERYFKTLENAVNRLYANSMNPNYNDPMFRRLKAQLLTYKNKQNLQQAIKQFKNSKNANYTKNIHVGDKWRIHLNENMNNNGIQWGLYKKLNNGRVVEYNLGINTGIHRIPPSTRSNAASTIQYYFRKKYRPARPFNNPEMQNIMIKHIIPKLGIKNKRAAVAAFRPPSGLNRALQAGARKSNAYWKAILNEITRKSILKSSKPLRLLTNTEFQTLWNANNTLLHSQNITPEQRVKILNIFQRLRKINPETGKRNMGAKK